MEALLINKEVDWSLMKDGFSIPVALQPAFFALTGQALTRSQSKEVTLIIDGKLYIATLKNQQFDQDKFYGHKDIVQIRYSQSSPISQRFREIFCNTYNYLYEERAKQMNKRAQIKVPNERKEYLLLFATGINDTYLVDYVLSDEHIEDLSNYTTEEQFETTSIDNWTDLNATIELKARLTKVRKIDHSICNNLKQLYDYRCQISGERIGDIHGGSVVEAHHIDYFVKSQNNDSKNIVILSPNYHRIIHKFHPVFDRKKKQFLFANGAVEKITVDKHL